MKKRLVLAEKPSVGKEIGRVLGCHQGKKGYVESKDTIVTWALGHLVTLADPGDYDKKYDHWELEDLPIIPEKLKLKVISGSRGQYNTVKQLMRRDDVGEIVIATDAGREGELVARWIIAKAGVKKPVKRLWISSITDKAIRQGFDNLRPGKEYEDLYKAAIARAEGDWVVGINATRALTTKHNAQLSCGRVQTPTIAIIAKREADIRNFHPKKFYGAQITVEGQTLTWKDSKGQSNSFNEDKVDAVIKESEGGQAKVVELSTKDKKSYPDALYDLTTLQREAYQKYKYSPKKTLSLMQTLYERHKALTYPRTDSRFLTDDMVDTLSERLQAISIDSYRKEANKLARQTLNGSKRFVDNKKVSDHHAIIPTEEGVDTSDLSFDERNIYEMVVKRFIEVLMPAYEYQEVTMKMDVKGESFVAKAKKTKALGYKALSQSKGDNEEMVDVKLHEHYPIASVKKTTGETKAPPLFNEGTLLQAMENPGKYMEESNQEIKKVLSDTDGLGTVATRADIIEKLFKTEYIVQKGKGLVVTKKGHQLLTIAPEALKSPATTGKWEMRLNAIAKGKESHIAFVNELKDYTHEIVSQIKGSTVTYKHDNITSTKCPECGKLMLSKKTKHGSSLVCQDRECGYRKNLSKVTNARCPECHVKLELRGEGDKKIFVCSRCGFKEKLSSFEKRKKASGKSGGKRDYQNYLKQQKKEAEKQALADNPFAKALAGLKVDK